MDFGFNDEYKMIQKMYREFAEKEIKPLAEEIDENERFPKESVQKMADNGMLGIPFPEEYGGEEGDYLSYVIAVEELSKVCASTGVTLSAHTSLGSAPIYDWGTEEQKQKYLTRLASGECLGAFGLTEPNAGTDASRQKTTAVKKGDHYVLNGSKCFITNGGIADVYVVFANVDRSKGLKGLTAFIVERSRPGVSTGKEEDKFGIRLSNTCDVIFEDVRVPAANRLGEEGEGFKIAMRTLDLSRPFIGAIAVGISQRALDEAVSYSKTRVTFGKPIAKQQALQFMMADMDMQTEAARQTVIYCINRIMMHLPYSREAAICKCFAGDTAVKSALDAIQILGGYGYSREYPVEKLLRDAKIFQIFEGTNQIQRVVIAGQLLK